MRNISFVTMKPILRLAFYYLAPVALKKVFLNFRATQVDKRQVGREPADIFGDIYRTKAWGEVNESKFCSGLGSTDPAIVGPYVEAVKAFLLTFGDKPSVADLGCGDFRVGSSIRRYCGDYIACDVVPELVAELGANPQPHWGAPVDFRCVDLTTDNLPNADIAFIRQVLQHMDNDSIVKVVVKLKKYNHIIVTEHLPESESFVANIDKSMGPGTRVSRGSGVVLGLEPFKLELRRQVELCSVCIPGGRVVTSLFSRDDDLASAKQTAAG